jgi:tubulin polyglutamylase TTLL5
MGIDNDLLWSKIYDVIIKSLIAIDGNVQSHLKKMTSKNSCFELLGFDILIDENLKPWLVEVNLSPSLACDSPIDLKIKHNLIIDTMNIICMKKFDRRRESINKMK